MPQSVTELHNSLEAKFAAIEGELDPQKAGELLAEAKGIQAQIVQIQANESGLNELKSWHNGSAAPRPQDAGTLLNVKSAGRSEIKNERGNSVLYQDGEGLLSDKQLALVQSDDYSDAVKNYLRRGGDINRMGKKDAAQLMEGFDENGGFLAPADMISRLIERKPTPTSVAPLVSTLNTSRDRVTLPRANYNVDDIYTSGVRVNWTGENGAPGNTNGPTFGTFGISIYTAMLSLGITNDMIEDASMPVMSYVSEKIRETWDIERDQMILKGSGTGQPFGLLNRIGTGDYQIKAVASGDNAKITADALVGMTYEIPEQYLDNQRWVFNRRSTERAVALLKDDQKRPLFYSGNDSYANARPENLVGFDLTRSALMPDIAANAYPILHGDLRAYYWIQRVGLTLQILNEVEALNNKKVIVARVRAGGDLAEAWRLRAMKIAASL